MENSLKDIQETVFGTRRYKNTTLKFAIISTLFAFQVRKTRSLIKGNLLPQKRLSGHFEGGPINFDFITCD